MSQRTHQNMDPHLEWKYNESQNLKHCRIIQNSLYFKNAHTKNKPQKNTMQITKITLAGLGSFQFIHKNKK